MLSVLTASCACLCSLQSDLLVFILSLSFSSFSCSSFIDMLCSSLPRSSGCPLPHQLDIAMTDAVLPSSGQVGGGGDGGPPSLLRSLLPPLLACSMRVCLHIHNLSFPLLCIYTLIGLRDLPHRLEIICGTLTL